MRRFVFVLMIALLLMRGWVGDVMATEMAAGGVQPPPSATKIVASHAHETGAEADFHTEVETVATGAGTAPDCTGHATDDASHDADSHCESCAACQACHTVALWVSPPAVNAVFHDRLTPLSGAAQFASADTALRQKPPIS